jgi:hypothetical protein
MVNDKLNISVGPPIKRVIDGIIYCQEERILGKWIRLMRAVAKHKRYHRKLLRQQRRKKQGEFEYWLEVQRKDELRERLQQLKYGR